MNVLWKGPKEDCFDKEFIWEYIFTEHLTEIHLVECKKNGKIEIFTNFLRPLFRYTGTTGMQIKGILGSNRITVFFSSRKNEEMAILNKLFSIKNTTAELPQTGVTDGCKVAEII
ncbi:hypothetical protein KKF34_01875 [Myxococcota bacterium]|nr:hypothetical protein [Myxococcota bacterium]MBU1382760.1 hypothetical protein [Myxococcota bacterium]MBU1495608.1 hypothetical protein [Myxococcota bacterium]